MITLLAEPSIQLCLIVGGLLLAVACFVGIFLLDNWFTVLGIVGVIVGITLFTIGLQASVDQARAEQLRLSPCARMVQEDPEILLRYDMSSEADGSCRFIRREQ